METKLQKSTKYTGNYRGINFLISLHGVDELYNGGCSFNEAIEMALRNLDK